ncbi:DNA repair protein RAD51 homolog 4 [Carica papaya]|uniref:DNA repair protein RAD51 homolog 4 n=1 Tax=Carica papaya TaxID=3649 RepID=UPI000B8D0AC1|nr:DNA repair protein RAD51 homolog 4 [Carica papaya]
MAPLKHLEGEYPIIDADFQNFCASRGIFSVEDFLVQDLDVLAAFADQHTASERLKEGIMQILSVIDGMHQPWLNGMELLEDAQHNKHVLSTGCEGIDLFLEGGLREGQVTELVGPSSSGKTQVCLHAAASVAKENVGHVLYLDTGITFTPRLKQHIIDLTIVTYKQGISFHFPLVCCNSQLFLKVTNHTVGGEGGISKPALGESWKSIPHVRLLLSRDHGNNVCSISVLKHPSMASGKATRFTICD